MTVHDLPDTFPGCEACHMGGRKSKKVVTCASFLYLVLPVRSTFPKRLSGKMYSSDPPYRPLAVNKRSGEPEDTDDDSGRGYRQSEFAIGRECLVRAQTFHELQRVSFPRVYVFLAQTRSLEISNGTFGGRSKASRMS